jgi:phospholipase C
MNEISRRRFLQGAAALGAGAAAWPLLDQRIALAQASATAQAPAKLKDLDHIIILMKENRSFDHYFGTMRGVRGFADAGAMKLTGGASVFQQPDSENPSGYVLPFRLNTLHTSGQRIHDLDHSWDGLHGALNGGKMDRWLPTRRAADGDRAPLTMSYLAREDLPFYYALADAFTICDAYHASVIGPTHPNRYALMTGNIDPEGKHGGPALDNRGRGYSWETYPERLERAGISGASIMTWTTTAAMS